LSPSGYLALVQTFLQRKTKSKFNKMISIQINDPHRSIYIYQNSNIKIKIKIHRNQFWMFYWENAEESITQTQQETHLHWTFLQIYKKLGMPPNDVVSTLPQQKP